MPCKHYIEKVYLHIISFIDRNCSISMYSKILLAIIFGLVSTVYGQNYIRLSRYDPNLFQKIVDLNNVDEDAQQLRKWAHSKIPTKSDVLQDIVDPTVDPGNQHDNHHLNDVRGYQNRLARKRTNYVRLARKRSEVERDYDQYNDLLRSIFKIN